MKGNEMRLKDLKDKVAIVGVGNVSYDQLYRTRDPQRDSYSLGFEAFKNALDDSGLSNQDIDGMITCRIPSYNKMCYELGVNHPKYTHWQPAHGRMSGMGLQEAAMAVYTGMADYVAVVYGNDGRSIRVYYGGEGSGTDNYNTPYGMSSPGASWALMWQRYMHEFNVKEDALGTIAMTVRNNASKNPDAVMKTPLTMEDYLNARYISYPLRLFDYCLINDGAVCFIVTTAERAKDCKKHPVYIKGIAQLGQHTSFYHTPTFNYDVMKSVAERVYGMAGVGPKDIDCAQIYDNFLPNIPISLEGFGFCNKGEATRWVQGGRIDLDGELPINTSGGHCSESYMQGFALHVEAVRQLRGECGERQVKDCELVQYICNSPITTTHILGR